MSAPITILWLRRDLRLADHPALIAAAAHAQETGGRLLPIFIWEPRLIAGPRASANRTWYLRESLAELDVNPIVVRPTGAGCVVVDALIVPRVRA